MELALWPEFSNKRVRLVDIGLWGTGEKYNNRQMGGGEASGPVSASTNGTSFRGLTIRETACYIVYMYEMWKAMQTFDAKQVSGP
jgi:hypothetical protein